MTTTKTTPELFALLQAVAACLGATFNNNNYEGEAKGRMTMPDGTRFFVNADSWGSKGKLTVGSSYPAHVHRADGSEYVTVQRDFSSAPTLDSINISCTKTPEQIANDIKRRFLPAYAPLYAEALAYCARQADYWQKHNDLAVVAAEALKPFGYNSGKTIRASVNYIHGDGARVELDNLDADKLRKLAAFLQTL